MQKTSSQQYKITQKQQLNSQVKLLKIYAPDIAQKAKAGQFVILKTRPNSERIPLTIAAWDKGAGTITLVFQEVGFSTIEPRQTTGRRRNTKFSGTLREPKRHKKLRQNCCSMWRGRTAAAYPIARALKEANNIVVTIMGARNKDLLILENEMKQVSDEFYIATDDGSKGQTGLVTEVLKTQITQGTSPFNVVYAVGPPMMMNAVCHTPP